MNRLCVDAPEWKACTACGGKREHYYEEDTEPRAPPSDFLQEICVAIYIHIRRDMDIDIHLDMQIDIDIDILIAVDHIH